MREHERDTENVNERDGVRELDTNNGKRPKLLPRINLVIIMIGLKKPLMMMTLGA